MKHLLLYSLAATVLFASCHKSNSALPDLSRVPTPLITKDASGNATIDGNSPNTFNGKVIVDLFYKTDVKPAKFDLVVIKNGDKSIVKTIQAGITTFPTTVTVTGLELATLFGTPIVVGDQFEIGADITTQSGQKFEAFPLSGNAYGANIANQPGASTSVIFTAVCPFDINNFIGAGHVVDPDFWGDTYPVTVTLQGTNVLKVTGWVEEPTYSILIKVDPVGLTATIDKQVYGPTLPTTPYTNPAVQGTGTVDACKLQIIMNLANSVTQGSFGSATTILEFP